MADEPMAPSARFPCSFKTARRPDRQITPITRVPTPPYPRVALSPPAPRPGAAFLPASPASTFFAGESSSVLDFVLRRTR